MDLESQLPHDTRLAYLSQAINSTNLNQFKGWLSVLLSEYEVSDLLNLYWCMDLVCKKNLPAFASELLRHGVIFCIEFAQTAAEWKATDVLEVFIERQLWDINQNLSSFTTPLLGEVIQDESIVRWFLNYGADVNKRCVLNLTPLSRAVEKAPVSTIKLLLDNWGDVNKGCLLHHAINRRDNCVETLELLLSYGAYTDYIMYDPEEDKASFDMVPFADLGTPLHVAIKKGNFEAVKCLLQYGADVRKLDVWKRSPLELAKSKNDPEILRCVEYYLSR